MQIKIHPLFFVLALAMVATGHAVAFLCTISALVLHEIAHALLAKERGFQVKSLVLLPFGAMMSVEERFDRASSVIIGLAGPICNLLVALLTLGIWWLFPEVYAYTHGFFYANMALGLFNLLPIYPLDGSRIVLGLCKNKLKAIKGLQIAGIVCSFLLLALFVATLFFKPNFSFGIMAVFLFYGAAFGTKEEMYISILTEQSKNYSLGVEKRIVKISKDTPIVRFYHHINSLSETLFVIVDEHGREIKRVSESQLRQIALSNKLSTPIGQAL